MLINKISYSDFIQEQISLTEKITTEVSSNNLTEEQVNKKILNNDSTVVDYKTTLKA